MSKKKTNKKQAKKTTKTTKSKPDFQKLFPKLYAELERYRRGQEYPNSEFSVTDSSGPAGNEQILEIEVATRNASGEITRKASYYATYGELKTFAMEILAWRHDGEFSDAMGEIIKAGLEAMNPKEPAPPLLPLGKRRSVEDEDDEDDDEDENEDDDY